MREHHWPFLIIQELYLDEIDYMGLMWVYKDIIDSIEQSKRSVNDTNKIHGNR